MKILSKIRGFYVMIEFVITVLMTIILMYAFRNNTHIIRRTWGRLQTFLMGFRIKQIGDVAPSATLLVLNHQSLVDIVALETIYPKNLCWIAKKEIEDIPLFGHIIPAPRMISIDRNDKRSLIKMIKEGKERVSEGRVLAMFPEGTRGRGDRLLKFQSGAKILAEKLELIVQPAIIVGARHILDSKSLDAHGGEVKVIYLDPINPKEDEQWFEKMYITMEERLALELASKK
ncbi:lysophospholipid acyltransferase family protein [Sulfurospirillum sp.]|uniref:lysophospholipid acyltransferase family protein n=1 Tax=Sulfurospirillum sp. TaxID=2053622 RepID=UPI002FDDB6A6